MLSQLPRIVKSISFISLFALGGCQSVGSAPANAASPGAVEYQVTLTSTWTAENFPLEYPEAGVVSGPHFSGLIGATHGNGYRLFRENQLPTPGLERLSEEGKHDPLNQEIQKAIGEQRAGMLFESGPLRDFSTSAGTKLKVTEQYPMVSAVAMIAPSPDWFTGVKDIPLKEGGVWVQNKTITLYAWDSGGDSGTSYKSPDHDNNPKMTTQQAGSPHFIKNGQMVPVGTLSFSRL